MTKRVAAKDKLREFFRQNIGKVVSKEQLREVAAPVTEWARRVREIRDEDGWPILTHNDDTRLKPGEYILREEPLPDEQSSSKRRMSSSLRFQVLDRDGYACVLCGAGHGDYAENGRPVRLHIDHIEDHSHGGDERIENLRVLCADCNQGAKNLSAEPPTWTRLRAHLLRAKVDDQRRVLEWLLNKFSKEQLNPRGGPLTHDYPGVISKNDDLDDETK